MNYTNNCHIERINSLITLLDATDPGWLQTDCNWKRAKAIQVSPKHRGKPELANREHFLLPTGVSFCNWHSDVYLEIPQDTRLCSSPRDGPWWCYHALQLGAGRTFTASSSSECWAPKTGAPLWVQRVGCSCLIVQNVILNKGHQLTGVSLDTKWTENMDACCLLAGI